MGQYLTLACCLLTTFPRGPRLECSEDFRLAQSGMWERDVVLDF